MIQHYRAEDGIQGYAEGDILIETGSGDTVAAVRDGRGVALTPTVADVPFAAAGDVRAIGLRLAPLDVGFDLRATGAAVAVGPGATLRASYATRDGARRVVSGPRAGVLAVLRAHGYDVVETTGGRSC